jgi:hypothetical protein
MHGFVTGTCKVARLEDSCLETTRGSGELRPRLGEVAVVEAVAQHAVLAQAPPQQAAPGLVADGPRAACLGGGDTGLSKSKSHHSCRLRIALDTQRGAFCMP